MQRDEAQASAHAADHRAGDHRTGEHRAGEHRAGEHRAGDRRAGDNRSSDHRSSDHQAGDHRAKDRWAEIRQRIGEILDQGNPSDRTSILIDRILVALILINLVAVILESVPSIDTRLRPVFVTIEIVSLVVFSAEFFLRLWVVPDHGPGRGVSPAQARWRYLRSPAGLVDLLAIVPFWFMFWVPEDFRVILVFRVVRFLKLTRYSPGMTSLLDALHAERRALLGCLVIFCGVVLFAAVMMYLAERHVQPDKLGTIPDALWWAFVTLGTVGYGDIVPVTPLGKVIAGATILCAIVVMALPVGIVATAFAEQIHRRDFVVTWGMVARVPLFSELSAGEIADIMRYLRAQTVNAGDVIVRAGDQAHSMYFITRGEVDIDVRGRHVTLGVGHFFGEVAVLRHTKRSATVTAIGRADLLVLDGDDLHRLLERSPQIASRIEAVVRERLADDLVTRKGDMVGEEIAQAEARVSRR